jgi:hypothetical protein
MIPGVLPAYITVEAYHAKLARLAANAARAETPAWCARVGAAVVCWIWMVRGEGNGTTERWVGYRVRLVRKC